jgi:hypothetical protein
MAEVKINKKKMVKQRQGAVKQQQMNSVGQLQKGQLQAIQDQETGSDLALPCPPTVGKFWEASE